MSCLPMFSEVHSFQCVITHQSSWHHRNIYYTVKGVRSPPLWTFSDLVVWSKVEQRTPLAILSAFSYIDSFQLCFRKTLLLHFRHYFHYLAQRNTSQFRVAQILPSLQGQMPYQQQSWISVKVEVYWRRFSKTGLEVQRKFMQQHCIHLRILH